MIAIPTPHFYTFYNGTEDYPQEETLYLSNAFKKKDEDISLELKVKVIDINPSKHHQILENCEVLREYSEFIEVTRSYSGQKESMEQAVRECIDRGILQRKSSEVMNMLMDEYNYELDIEVQREEAEQKGERLGYTKGKSAGIDEGVRKCILLSLSDLGAVPAWLKKRL